MNGRRSVSLLLLVAITCITTTALPLDSAEDDIIKVEAPAAENSTADLSIDKENDITSIKDEESIAKVKPTKEDSMFSGNGDEELIPVKDENPTSTSSNDEATPEMPSENPQHCFRIVNITLLYTAYIDGPDGVIEINKTRVITNKKCCDGYDTAKCTLKKDDVDLCNHLSCMEDPDSRCVVVRRCGIEIPVFVNSKNILSEICTQPDKANLCLNDICDSESTCPGDHNKEAICFRRGCRCSDSQVWLFQNGNQAQC